jgi:hypothetical protein
MTRQVALLIVLLAASLAAPERFRDELQAAEELERWLTQEKH